MTHEELLAKIDYFIKYQAPSAVEFFDALRAVVELHKPALNNPEYKDNDCMNCWVDYPCPTIQAIEKELK